MNPVIHPLLTIRPAMKRRYAREMAPVLEKWQLNSMEADVLLFLGNNPGYDTASDMVQLRQLTKSHVSKAVEHLTARGFLTQARDEKNRRKIHLTPTQAAEPVLAQAQSALDHIAAIINDGVSQEDSEAIIRVTNRVIENVQNALDD